MKQIIILKEKYLSLAINEKKQKLLWILELYINETDKQIFKEIFNKVKNQELPELYINQILETILDELYKYKSSQIKKLEKINISLKDIKEKEKIEKEKENYESILNSIY